MCSASHLPLDVPVTARYLQISDSMTAVDKPVSARVMGSDGQNRSSARNVCNKDSSRYKVSVGCMNSAKHDRREICGCVRAQLFSGLGILGHDFDVQRIKLHPSSHCTECTEADDSND